ncbi:MAG: DUF4280 domain-containing protein [Hymenobacter sp.]|nr:DUF4280 domain-containing protein [Hymenobacter sp.]
MSQTDQELVCHGALCRCDKSSAPSPLQVSSNQSVWLQDKLVATSLDKLFVPFGTCALKNNQSCVPALLLWQDVFELVEVLTPGCHPLLEKSIIMCSVGGKVSILNTLQIAMPGLPAPPRVEAARAAFMSLCPLLLNEDD